MAGLTTASLVSLYEPSERENWSLIRSLGLSPVISVPTALSLLSTAFLSISFLVFLNAGQGFVLTEIVGVPDKSVGSLTGTLILGDELVSLGMVLVWGIACTEIGVREVGVTGNAIVGIAFFVFVQCTSFNQLFMARLLYAMGASALVTSLTAGLALLTPVEDDKVQSSAQRFASQVTARQDREESVGRSRRSSEEVTNERTSLLATAQKGSAEAAPVVKADPMRFVGIVGAIAGCGALMAVFGYLRLPTYIGLKNTFYVVGSLAIIEAALLFFFFRLPIEITAPAAIFEHREDEAGSVVQQNKAMEIFTDLVLGFKLATEREVLLCFATGFATRAQGVIVAAYLPLFINNFFRQTGICEKFDLSLVPTATCRPALILASKLTGTVQLVSLIFCPIIGFLSSRYAPARILLFTLLTGASSFALFALLPRGDPRNPLTFAIAMAMGVSQAGGLVLSLGLVGKARASLVKREGREIGGSLAGAYSACGGLGILLVGKLSGSLFDKQSWAPFGLIALVDTIVALVAIYCIVRDRN